MRGHALLARALLSVTLTLTLTTGVTGPGIAATIENSPRMQSISRVDSTIPNAHLAASPGGSVGGTKIRFAPGVVEMATSDLVQSRQTSPAGTRLVTLAGDHVELGVGTRIVANATQRSPYGIGGIITRRAFDGRNLTVEVSPLPASELFSEYRLSTKIDLRTANALIIREASKDQAGYAPAVSGLTNPAVEFTCGASVTAIPTMSLDLSDTQISLDIDLAARRFRFDSTFHPKARFEYLAGEALTCTAQGLSFVNIPLPGGFVLQMRPKVVLSIGVGGKISAVWDPTFRTSFTGSSGTAGSNPSFSNHGTFSAAPDGGSDLFVGTSISVLFAASAGLSGDIGGVLYFNKSSNGLCVEAWGKIRVALSVEVRTWVMDWSFTLAQGDFLATKIASWCAESNNLGSNSGPVVTVVPSVLGTPTCCNTLASSGVAFSGSLPIGISLGWERCTASGACSQIPGAFGNQYALSAGDVGFGIRVSATATNAFGSSTIHSQTSRPVDAPLPIVRIGSLTGPMKIGGQLVLSTIEGSGVGDVSETEQWQRCNATLSSCSDIPGATTLRYTLTAADIGFRIREVITTTDFGGSVVTVSDATAIFEPAGYRVDRIEIMGVPAVGNLYISTGMGYGTPDGDSLASSENLWMRCDVDGSNCVPAGNQSEAPNGDQYRVVAEDEGHTLKLRILCVSALGVHFLGDSAITELVAPAPSPPGLNPPMFSPGSGLSVQVYRLAPGSSATVNHLSLIWQGSSQPSVEYTWLRCPPGVSVYWLCEAIPSSNAVTHPISSEDIGNALMVRIHIKNPYGENYTLTPLTEVVKNFVRIDSPQVTPSFTYDLGANGYTLRLATIPSFFGSAPWSLGFEWFRCEADRSGCQPVGGIAGTDQQYSPTISDAGHTFFVRIRALGPDGASDPVDSSFSDVMDNVPPMNVNNEPASVYGDYTVGHTLWVRPPSYVGTQPMTVHFQWLRFSNAGLAEIPGATQSFYSPTVDDIGAAVLVRTWAVNDMGVTPESAAGGTFVSAPSIPVSDPLFEGGVELADGSKSVTSDSVAIVVRPPLSALEMQVSNYADFHDASWQVATTAPLPWVLLRMADGAPSHVYARFRGGVASTYPVSSMGVEFDVKPPTVQPAITSRDEVGNGSIRLDANDEHGVAVMAVVANATDPATWHPYETTVAYLGSPSQRWAYFRDPLGNTSGPVSIMIGDPVWNGSAVACAPSFRDALGVSKDSYVIPRCASAEYRVGGVTQGAGTYPASGSVEIVARARPGYTLSGVAKWSHSFDRVGLARMVGPGIALPAGVARAVPLTWSKTGSSYGSVSFNVQVQTVGVLASGAPYYSRPVMWRSKVTATTGTLQGSPAVVYRLRSQALDATGAVTSWSPWTRVIMPVDDRVGVSVGSWSAGLSSSAYAGTYRATRAAKASLAFSGWTSEIRLIGSRGVGNGRFSVYVDGSYRGTYDSWSRLPLARQILCTFAVPYGKHSLRVVNSATSGRNLLVVDGVSFAR